MKLNSALITVVFCYMFNQYQINARAIPNKWATNRVISPSSSFPHLLPLHTYTNRALRNCHGWGGALLCDDNYRGKTCKPACRSVLNLKIQWGTKTTTFQDLTYTTCMGLKIAVGTLGNNLSANQSVVFSFILGLWCERQLHFLPFGTEFLKSYPKPSYKMKIFLIKIALGTGSNF